MPLHTKTVNNKEETVGGGWSIMKAVQNSLYQMIYCTTKTPNIFKSGRVLCSIVMGGAWYKVYHPSSIRALTFRGKTMANRSVLNLLDKIDHLFRD